MSRKDNKPDILIELGDSIATRILNALTKRDTQQEIPQGSVILGEAQDLYYPDKLSPVVISPKERSKHCYIAGSTGSGKTKLIEHMIRSDIQLGNGFCLIDPHGDLSLNILKYIANLPQDSFDPSCFILVEPFDRQYSIGFNPLEVPKNVPVYSHILELMRVFRKIWGDRAWGPRMDELLRNSLVTLAENQLTLLEARALLTESNFRKALINRTTNQEVKEYWIYRYNSLSERMQGMYREPVLNKVSVFVTDPNIRYMVGQTKSTLNFRDIMDEGKWVILNLSKGFLKENSYLLGGLFLTKLQMAAMSRADIPEEKRRPFNVYIDEFQNFSTKEFEVILSEARKYRLVLHLAHQNVDQIHRELRASILANVWLQIFFRLSHRDAALLADEINPKNKQEVIRKFTDLHTREAYIKIKGQEPRLMQTAYVEEAKASDSQVEVIRNLSRQCHARKRTEIEKEIQARRASIESIDFSQEEVSETLKISPLNSEEFEEGQNAW
ncbi:type IV secretion system DNA-binding domain-containing protein [candidate division WOR-3 bacterium]|nr:type IV secretion system DNA-binding domain-containing protein [candidate division WOR-3 bacterium]